MLFTYAIVFWTYFGGQASHCPYQPANLFNNDLSDKTFGTFHDVYYEFSKAYCCSFSSKACLRSIPHR